VLSLLKAAFALALLAVPLLVITALPRLFELAGSVPWPSPDANVVGPAPAFRLVGTTPIAGRSRFASLEDTPPPTLAPPEATVTPVATPRPTPSGERIVIGNTGGRGAVLRAEPVTGRPVGALREQQVLDVLERRNIPGGGDWVHVRTSDGADGWITGLVALPFAPPNR
jgi:Bacterial SH3 domain